MSHKTSQQTEESLERTRLSTWTWGWRCFVLDQISQKDILFATSVLSVIIW